MISILLIYPPMTSATPSYSRDWVDTFQTHPGLRVDSLCSKWRAQAAAFWSGFLPAQAYDGIVILHATSNNMGFGQAAAKAIQRVKGKRFFFMGNEHRELQSKISLAKAFQTDALVSQCPLDVATAVYRPHFEREILSIPHGLNEKVFTRQKNIKDRPLDVMYRGEQYPYYLGHNDREKLLGKFKELVDAEHLRGDIAPGRSLYLGRDAWVQLLNESRTTLATEAGSNFMSTDETLREEVNRYGEDHPQATFEEVMQNVIASAVRNKTYVNGRIVSARHFDAMGTGTCLISFKGRFNDILQADKHYIAIEPDFSNIDSAIQKVKDPTFLSKMSNECRDMVLAGHTLRHRVESLLKHL